MKLGLRKKVPLVFTKTAVVLSSLCAVLLFLYIAVTTVGFNIAHYEAEYQKANTATSIGISQDGLLRITQDVIDYLQDKRDTMQREEIIQGENRLVFNERELAHMVDVKNLFLGGRMLAMGSAVLLLILLLLLKFVLPRGKAGVRYRWALRTWNFVWLGFMLLGTWVAIDFEGAFIAFHKVFFSNELWQMWPTDVLIQMVPETFFFSAVLKIGIIFVGLMLLTMILCFYLKKRESRRADDAEPI